MNEKNLADELLELKLLKDDLTDKLFELRVLADKIISKSLEVEEAIKND